MTKVCTRAGLKDRAALTVVCVVDAYIGEVTVARGRRVWLAGVDLTEHCAQAILPHQVGGRHG